MFYLKTTNFVQVRLLIIEKEHNQEQLLQYMEMYRAQSPTTAVGQIAWARVEKEEEEEVVEEVEEVVAAGGEMQKGIKVDFVIGDPPEAEWNSGKEDELMIQVTQLIFFLQSSI